MAIDKSVCALRWWAEDIHGFIKSVFDLDSKGLRLEINKLIYLYTFKATKSDSHRLNMGVVRRQSIQSAILIYIGFLIGALNMLMLFPHFFSKEEVGLTRVILDVQILMASFCSMGAVTVIIKFFPYYQASLKNRPSDLPFLTGAICLLGYIIFLVLGYFFSDFIIQKLGARSPLFKEYFYLIYPAIFFYLFYVWLEAFAWGYQKSVLTTFMKETALRIITTLLILLYIIHLIDYKIFMTLFSTMYAIPCLVIVVHLLKTTNWRIHFIISPFTLRLKYILVKFLVPAFGTGVLYFLSRTADTLFLTGMKGLGDAAIFTIATYIIGTMEVPQRSMTAIAAPVLAESWRTGDKNNIQKIYSQSALNLLIAGIFIFGVIWVNLNNLAKFLPPQYAIVNELILVLSLAKLIDLGTGLNAYIIALSKYRMVEFYSNVFFSALALPLNYFLIKKMGIMGAAYGGLISLTLYNLVRYFFIWSKFKLQPFSVKNVYTAIIGVLTIIAIKTLPVAPNFYIDTMVRMSLFALIYFTLIIKLNISTDINHIVLGNLAKFKIKF